MMLSNGKAYRNPPENAKQRNVTYCSPVDPHMSAHWKTPSLRAMLIESFRNQAYFIEKRNKTIKQRKKLDTLLHIQTVRKRKILLNCRQNHLVNGRWNH